MPERFIGARAGPTRDELVSKAREVYLNRRVRERRFGSALFDEAAWDMLLVLYINDATQRHFVDELALLSEAPGSTGLRWLNYIESQGWIRRGTSDGHGSAFVQLTEKARRDLDAYFAEIIGGRA